MTEWHIQREFVDKFKIHFPDKIMFHIPNGFYSTPKNATLMKYIGLLPGVPDVLILGSRQADPRRLENHITLPKLSSDNSRLPEKEYNGLFIEFKSIRGYLSPPQEVLFPRFRREGYCVHTCFSADLAIALTLQYFDPYSVIYQES